MRISSRAWFIFLSVAAWFVVALVLLAHLSWGVDFTDEAYYLAQSLVFSQGTAPYVDEILSMQSAFILLAPVVHSFRWFHGNLDGIVLSFRYFYFGFTFIAAFFVYRFFRRSMDLPEALWSALIMFSFWPFGIPAFSYNTIGMWALVFATLCLLGSGSGDPFKRLPLAIVAFGLAIFCYPTFALCILPATFFVYRQRHKLCQTASGRLSLVLGLVLLAGGIYLACISIGLERVQEIYSYAQSDGQHLDLWKKIGQIFGQLKHDRGFISGALATLVAALAVFRFYPFASFPIAGVMFFLAMTIPLKGMAIPSNHLLVTLLSLVAVPIAVRNFFRQEGRVSDILSLSALGFGIVAALTSANGLINMPMGSFFGVIVSLLVIATYLDLKKIFGRIFFTTLCLSIVFFQLREVLHLPFGDGPAVDLDTVVDFGPFQGLTTSRKKVHFLRAITRDLETVRSSNGTIAFFDSFPAGYLISDMKMLAPTVFPVTPNLFPVDREFLLSFYKDSRKLPDLFVLMHTLPRTSKRSYDLHLNEGDPVLKLLSEKYEDVIRRSDYVIYRRSGKSE